MRLIFTIMSTVFVLAASVAEAGATWLAPVDISPASGSARNPEIDFFSNGNALATWRFDKGQGHLIHASTRPAGESWSEPTVVDASDSTLGAPELGSNGDSSVVAVWSHLDSQKKNWFVRTSTKSGTGDWSNLTDLTDGSFNAFNQQIDVNSSGAAVSVWMRLKGPKYVVQARLRSVGGQWGPADDLSDSCQVSSHMPQVSIAGTGAAVAVWQCFDGANYRIQSASLVEGAWKPTVDLSNPAKIAVDPQVAVDKTGTAHSVWSEYDGVDFTVRSRSYKGGWNAPVSISNSGKIATKPDITVDGYGNAVAVWNEFDKKSVYTARYPTNGSWGLPEDLSNGDEKTDAPKISTNSNGQMAATWLSYETNSGTWIVKGSTRDIGKGWTTAEALSDAGEDAENPRVAVDVEGNTLATWQRPNGQGSDIIQAAGYDATRPKINSTSIPSEGALGEGLNMSVKAFDAWSGISAIEWSFGDGESANGASVTHAYKKAHTYSVSVKVTDGVGYTYTKTSLVKINSPALPQQQQTQEGTQNGVPSEQSYSDDFPSWLFQYLQSESDDSNPATVRIAKPRRNQRLKHRLLARFQGTASGGPGISKVEFALARKTRNKKSCQFITKVGRLISKLRSCSSRPFNRASGRQRWQVKLKKLLRKGAYTLYVRAIDTRGNRSKTVHVSFKVI